MLRKTLFLFVMLVAVPTLTLAGKGNGKGGNGGSNGTPVAVMSCFTDLEQGIGPDSGTCYVDESLEGDPGLSNIIDGGTYKLTMNPDRVNFNDCCFYERYFTLDLSALPPECTVGFAGSGEVRLFLSVDLDADSAFGQVWGLVASDTAGWDTDGVILDLSWDAVDVTLPGNNELAVTTVEPHTATIKGPAPSGNKKVTCGTAEIPFDFHVSVPQP